MALVYEDGNGDLILEAGVEAWIYEDGVPDLVVDIALSGGRATEDGSSDLLLELDSEKAVVTLTQQSLMFY